MNKSNWTTRPEDYHLIIFDADGTLLDRDTGLWLSGAREWFNGRVEAGQRYAIASNQGGVGLRYWMLTEGFGNPYKYPEEADIKDFYGRYGAAINAQVYLCFAYQSKSSGKWAPVPRGAANEAEWNPGYRKPAPGMLLQAMSDADVTADKTLMVGDRAEDEAAARAAGCDFVWAAEFFGREA